MWTFEIELRRQYISSIFSIASGLSAGKLHMAFIELRYMIFYQIKG